MYDYLSKNYSIKYYLDVYINEKGVNKIREYMINNNKSIKEKYPVDNTKHMNLFIKEKNIEDTFPPYFVFSFQLYYI